MFVGTKCSEFAQPLMKDASNPWNQIKGIKSCFSPNSKLAVVDQAPKAQTSQALIFVQLSQSLKFNYSRLWDKRSPWNIWQQPLEKTYPTTSNNRISNFFYGLLSLTRTSWKKIQKLISIALCLFRSLEYVILPNILHCLPLSSVPAESNGFQFKRN